MEDKGIDFDDPHNGVCLPKLEEASEISGAAQHFGSGGIPHHPDLLQCLANKCEVMNKQEFLDFLHLAGSALTQANGEVPDLCSN